MNTRVKPSKADIAERLGAVPLFERCSKRDLRTVARHLDVVSVAPGTVVISKGNTGDAFFVVLAGELEVIDEGRATVGLNTGNHFGELALLDPAPRSATVVATSAVELCVLTVRMFRVLLRDMPQISERLLASLAHQLRDAREVARH